MKRQILSFILLGILLAPVMGISAWLLYQKARIRHEVHEKMIRGLGKENLVLLKFTPSQSEQLLDWEHASEFEYQGEMYDLVESEVKGDTIYYWCWQDREETRLNRQVALLIAKTLHDDPQRRKNQDRVVHFFQSLFFESGVPQLPLCHRNGPLRWLGLFHPYSSISPVPPAPPPRWG